MGSRPEKVTFELMLEAFITARSGAIWAVATGHEHHHRCGVSWEAQCHLAPSQECLLGWGFLLRGDEAPASLRARQAHPGHPLSKLKHLPSLNGWCILLRDIPHLSSGA